MLRGGIVEPNWLTMQISNKKVEETPVIINEKNICVYGTPLKEPMLGKHFELPPRNQPYVKPVLDKTLSYVRIFLTSLIIYNHFNLINIYFLFIRYQFIVI